VKDLVDMALLVGDGELDRRRTRDALHLTFERRGTHPLPTILDVPPPDWQIPFQALAEECRLSPDIAAAFERVRSFFRGCRLAQGSSEAGMTESGSESLPSERRPDEENRRLREENARLRQILAIHRISVPPPPPTDSTLTQAAGTASLESKEERARKRITLFRSLFRWAGRCLCAPMGERTRPGGICASRTQRLESHQHE